MKSLLKIGSGIVILVVLFFALFSIFLPGDKDSKQDAKVDQKQTATGIQSLNVSQTDTGVFLEIVGAENMNFTAQASDERTLVVDFPQTPLSLDRKMIPLPHPMIELIEAEEAEAGSKIKVTLTEAFEHSEQMTGNILMVRFNKPGEGVANAEEPAIEEPVQAEPSREPVLRKAKRPKPAPRKPAPAAPAPEPDDLISELGFEDDAAADTGDDLGLGTEEDLGFDDSGAVQPDDLALADGDLDDQGFTDDAASIDDAFADDGAAVQEPSVDTGAALANLPSITDISVDGSGRVSINHEGGRVPIKRFLRRPNQAVVELKDVSLNRLQVSQSAGGNVTGIKTEQFVNPQGSSISRVFILLSQMPDSRDNIIVRKGKGSVNIEVQGP